MESSARCRDGGVNATERAKIAFDIAKLLCPGGTDDEIREQAKQLLIRTDTELKECLQRLSSARGVPTAIAEEVACKTCGRKNDVGRNCYWCGAKPV